MKRLCSSMAEVANVFNHNTEIFASSIKQINGKLKKLEKKSHSLVWVGIILGTIVEFCIIEQGQKIKELDEKLNKLNMEIEELENKEGD